MYYSIMTFTRKVRFCNCVVKHASQDTSGIFIEIQILNSGTVKKRHFFRCHFFYSIKSMAEICQKSKLKLLFGTNEINHTVWWLSKCFLGLLGLFFSCEMYRKQILHLDQKQPFMATVHFAKVYMFQLYYTPSFICKCVSTWFQELDE